jgi:hypothetical protein
LAHTGLRSIARRVHARAAKRVPHDDEDEHWREAHGMG